MIPVRNEDGSAEIYLSHVDQFTSAFHAAHHLWQSVHEAAKKFGGAALLRTPEDGERGYLVRWDNGPKDWAEAYVVGEGADAPGFAATSDGDGLEVRFEDLD